MIGVVLVVSRFRVPAAERRRRSGADMRRRARRAGRAARLRSRARSAATSTTPSSGCSPPRWEHVGAYRRALSAYDVKLHAVPLLSRALDEPSAYEVVEPGTDLNDRRSSPRR